MLSEEVWEVEQACAPNSQDRFLLEFVDILIRPEQCSIGALRKGLPIQNQEAKGSSKPKLQAVERVVWTCRLPLSADEM